MTSELRIDPSAVRLSDGEGRADSVLRTASFRGKTLYLLRQIGTFPDLAYDHGRLLAPQIGTGAFAEIAAAIDRAIDSDHGLYERLAAALHRTYTERVHGSLSAEFRAAIDGVAEGYLAGSRRPVCGTCGATLAERAQPYSKRDVVNAMVAIEVENILAGLAHSQSLPGERLRAYAETLADALPRVFSRDTREALANIGRLALQPRRAARAAERLSSARNHIGFGCSAVAVPAGQTGDGRHLHARNLDNMIYRWSQAPVIALIDETPANPAYRRYVGFGSAGMIYPGGVSGINEDGLSVSIHQLTTARYRSRIRHGHGEIGPYIPQRVLREARTLDEAIDLVRGISAFTSWCVFVSSAAEGAAARIEITAETVRATRSDAPMAQANHYLHPDLVETAFDRRDAHFTRSFGKWLETRSRVRLLEARLAAPGPRDTGWAIDAMAATEDHALSPAPGRRAFGRTTCKSYGQMTSVVRGDPARRNRGDEVWMSLGERRPACASSLAGFTVDWERFELDPVAAPSVRRVGALAELPGYDASLHHFVEAAIAYMRPKDLAGAPLHRDPDAAETAALLSRTVALLDRAEARAAEDGIVEVPYLYMRARVRREIGDHAGALADLERLIGLWRAGGAAVLHPYEAALVLAFAVACADQAGGGSSRADRLAEARDLLDRVRREHFGDGPAHHDLLRWVDRLDRLERDGGAAFEAPEINFIVIE